MIGERQKVHMDAFVDHYGVNHYIPRNYDRHISKSS